MYMKPKRVLQNCIKLIQTTM